MQCLALGAGENLFERFYSPTHGADIAWQMLSRSCRNTVTRMTVQWQSSHERSVTVLSGTMEPSESSAVALPHAFKTAGDGATS